MYFMMCAVCPCIRVGAVVCWGYGRSSGSALCGPQPRAMEEPRWSVHRGTGTRSHTLCSNTFWMRKSWYFSPVRWSKWCIRNLVSRIHLFSWVKKKSVNNNSWYNLCFLTWGFYFTVISFCVLTTGGYICAGFWISSSILMKHVGGPKQHMY